MAEEVMGGEREEKKHEERQKAIGKEGQRGGKGREIKEKEGKGRGREMADEGLRKATKGGEGAFKSG